MRPRSVCGQSLYRDDELIHAWIDEARAKRNWWSATLYGFKRYLFGV